MFLEPSPSESSFSRLFDNLSNFSEIKQEFKPIVLKAKNIGIIDVTEGSIDSTKLNAV